MSLQILLGDLEFRDLIDIPIDNTPFVIVKNSIIHLSSEYEYSEDIPNEKFTNTYH